MQDTQSTRSPIVNRILIICGAVLVVGLITLGTALFLKNVIPKKEASTAGMHIKVGELISTYSVPGVINGLSDNLYDQQLDDGTSVPLVHKLDGHAYIASTQTSENVLFYSKTTSPQDDIKAIQDQTTVFMHSKGYEKVSNPATLDAKTVSRVTYASEKAVCQLTSSGAQTPEGSPSSHQLACAENTTVNDEYAATEKLLELYSKTKERPAFTEAVRSSESEGNKAYSVLYLANSKALSPLLFASVDNNWAYLGELNGTGPEANAKYALTPEIKAKISDSKYGTFLTRNLEGKSSS